MMRRIAAALPHFVFLVYYSTYVIPTLARSSDVILGNVSEKNIQWRPLRCQGEVTARCVKERVSQSIATLRCGPHHGQHHHSSPRSERPAREVLMRVTKVGLCGSDLCTVYTGKHGHVKIEMPCGVGHEAAGVVTKCGQDVTHVKPGDRVTVENGTSCGKCELCLTGKYNVCHNSSFHGQPRFYPGCLARYYKHKAQLVFKLPDSVSDEEGAMVEPLAVAVHACRRAQVWAGCSLLVTGAGPIGLLCLSVAKTLGATNILVTDIKESRLAMAKRMGADHTLLVTSGDAQSQAQQVQHIMGCQPDITLDCSGSKAGLSLGIYVTKSGGKLAQVGAGSPEVTVPLVHAATREVDILGVYRYVNCFPIAIDLLAKKLVDVKPLITHRFNFEEFQKAFDMFRAAEDGAVKCMISC